MLIVMGATGHVGSAVADELLSRGESVGIMTRHPDDADVWSDKGAIVVEADVEDAASLKSALRRGTRAFLLNPPADPASDTDEDELRTIANILAALDGTDLEKVVAASTYGARPGDAIGDLSTLWRLEQGLQAQLIPAAIDRGAYYMTNWLGYTQMVRDTGILPSMFPPHTEMPMVAPADLGRIAAERLLAPATDTSTKYIEGPSRYTRQNVADAFAAALQRDVIVEVAPRDTWEAVFKEAGFSAAAASAYARMTAVSLDSCFDMPAEPIRGQTDLKAFIEAAVNAKH